MEFMAYVDKVHQRLTDCCNLQKPPVKCTACH